MGRSRTVVHDNLANAYFQKQNYLIRVVLKREIYHKYRDMATRIQNKALRKYQGVDKNRRRRREEEMKGAQQKIGKLEEMVTVKCSKVTTVMEEVKAAAGIKTKMSELKRILW